MVKRIIRAFGGEFSNVHEAAYLLGFFALLAQILALFRDRLLAHYFGASQALDVYYASFRIPDLIFTTVASLVAGSVLIPFLQEKILDGHDKAKKLIDEVWSSFLILIVGTSIVTLVFMPQIVRILFATMSQADLDSVTSLSRLLLLSPILLGFSNFLSSIIQAHRRFGLYALSPVLYNAGIIGGIIFLSPAFGIKGVVVGVILGSILHAMVQIPFAKSIRLFPRFIYPIAWERMKAVMRLSLPRTLALAGMNIVILALVAMASRMAEGSISVFNFAYNLESGPLSIIGVSYSMAAFPTLAEYFSNGKKDKFAKHVALSFRHIIFLSLPITVMFIVIRAQIVRTVLGSGAFSWSDTRLVAACVALFSISLVAQNANLLFFRAYYASGKTKIPLIISTVSSIITVIISVCLFKVFVWWPNVKDAIDSWLKVQDIAGTEVLALPLGFSIGNILNLVLFAVFFNREYRGLFDSVKVVLWQGAVASIAGGFVAYDVLLVIGSITKLNTLAAVFSQGLVAGIAGLATWFVVLKLWDSEEIEELIKHLKARIFKTKVVSPKKMDI